MLKCGFFVFCSIVGSVILIYICCLYSLPLLSRIKCCYYDKIKIYFGHMRYNTDYYNNTQYNNTINSHNVVIEILGEIESHKALDDDEDCSICLNKIGNNEIYKLKCNHYFHLECWKQWENSVNNVSCPLCRYGCKK